MLQENNKGKTTPLDEYHRYKAQVIELLSTYKLEQDDVTLQSPETIEFIFNLLKS